MEFTVGFIFTENRGEVLLILKDRPTWQAGLWNGVGGKVEKDESLTSCISREVFEETNILIPEQVWKTVGDIAGNNWHVTIFTTTLSTPITPEQKTSEKPQWHKLSELPQNIVENLTILIPACLHTLTTTSSPMLSLTYHD